MRNYRHGNTGREMIETGAWVRIARQHYRHISGAEVRYDCDRWGWEVVGRNEFYIVLWAAKHSAERPPITGVDTQTAIG